MTMEIFNNFLLKIVFVLVQSGLMILAYHVFKEAIRAKDPGAKTTKIVWWVTVVSIFALELYLNYSL